MKVLAINKHFFVLTFKRFLFFYKYLIFVDIALLTKSQFQALKKLEIGSCMFNFHVVKKVFETRDFDFWKSKSLVLATNKSDLFFNCLLNLDFAFFSFEGSFSDISGAYFYELSQIFNQNFLFINYYIIYFYIIFILFLYLYILVFIELINLNFIK